MPQDSRVKPEKRVFDFVAGVARHLNRQRWWTSLTWSTAAGAGVLVVAGLWYVLRGYAIPLPLIAWCAAAIFLLAFVGWLFGRLRADRAARFADAHYGLKDAVSSSLHFAATGRRDGYYALQTKQTVEKIAPLDPTEIPYDTPRNGIMLAASLLAVAIPLSLQNPSDAVRQQQQLAEITENETAEINDELTALVEELRAETLDREEKKLIDPDKLRRWVDELETTEDQKEALRQYAKLERKLNEARLAVQRREEEQLLDRAAKELQKGDATKPLAKQLQQKKYKQAAEELAKMQPPRTASLEKWRRDLARLKAASQRMASAMRAAKSADKTAKGGAGEMSTGAEAAASRASASTSGNQASGAGAASQGGGGDELAQNIDELAASVEQLDEALKDAQRQASNLDECDAEGKGQCQACQQSVSEQLARLSKRLNKLAICRQCDKKLGKLCEKCSQCQGGLCQSLGACQSPGAGGQPPGWGSNAARRDARDELVDNGQTTQLKGAKGAGPSLTTVEAAEDGSGVSTRRSVERTRQFRRQLESFVAREDIPEQLKEGVKRYFENIHQIDQ
ncbi:hypothetical protein OAS39_04445 [Pirellulales bacterium]|nr:hypothetical protein [Pirellulales bacterium]